MVLPYPDEDFSRHSVSWDREHRPVRTRRVGSDRAERHYGTEWLPCSSPTTHHTRLGEANDRRWSVWCSRTGTDRGVGQVDEGSGHQREDAAPARDAVGGAQGPIRYARLPRGSSPTKLMARTATVRVNPGAMASRGFVR